MTDLRSYNRRRLANATFYALCTTCNEAAAPNRTKCPFHAAEDRQRVAERNSNRKKAGLCQTCGVNPTQRTECTRCREERANRRKPPL